MENNMKKLLILIFTLTLFHLNFELESVGLGTACSCIVDNCNSGLECTGCILSVGTCSKKQ
jgi:hypothetical protein